LVVIGNGMGGARLVEEIRRRGADALRITVYGDEPGGNYNRIMLSGVLGRHRAPDEIITHPPDWYAENDVTLRSGVRIARIDRDRNVVVDEAGNEQRYDGLVIATGSRPFVPPIPGRDHARVRVFRTLADCRGLHDAVESVRHAVVLGGGLLGLEAASGLRALGVDVTVLHLMPTLMEQQLDPGAGEALRAKIETLGIAVRTDARACEIRALDETRLAGVALEDGTLIEADLVVICCGIVPNAELARTAGLAVERGIIVDDGLRTSDPAIYAVGECVQHRGVTYGLVEPIWEMCRVLADRLAGTAASTYRGSKISTRLKVAGVNVVAVGTRDARPGDSVAMAIEPDGRYRRAIARDGILVGAQVVGDAPAAAAFAKAYERQAPLAGSVGAFVFSIDTIVDPRAAAKVDGEEQICVCNDVSRETIEAAIAAGATTIELIGEATAAGTGCGTCHPDLGKLITRGDTSARPLEHLRAG
ncbi:MAG TPA: FAD-dependent oxidoreductase, partial [Candidatus Acidoferrum sp.]|nr:FAD-dependent oxidoreductase [Candidatus Acidoferrum sp.]